MRPSSHPVDVEPGAGARAGRGVVRAAAERVRVADVVFSDEIPDAAQRVREHELQHRDVRQPREARARAHRLEDARQVPAGGRAFVFASTAWSRGRRLGRDVDVP